MGSAEVAAIVREHGRFVWRVLRYHGIPEHQLEDLSQEVFVVIVRRFDDFQGRSSLRTWIYGICRNVASASRRHRRRRPEVLTNDVFESAVPAAQAGTLARERARALVWRAMAELTEVTRMVFVLYEIEEMPMAEVAASVGCTPSTAYSRLYAARRHLRESLLAAGFEEADIELAEVS